MLEKIKKSYKHIIWDWNGTLLDDVNIVVDAMNTLLKRRDLPLITIDTYKNMFSFPVEKYYARLGFDFEMESFGKLASEFVSEFNSEKYQFKLYDGVEEVLTSVKKFGVGQSILSASQEKELIETVGKLNISDYFVRIAGLDNHYAASKIKRGKDLLAELGLEAKEVLLIGDTTHDYEVSKEIGCDCLLISNGHQSYEIISNCNTGIVEMILDVIDFIKEEAIA